MGFPILSGAQTTRVVITLLDLVENEGLGLRGSGVVVCDPGDLVHLVGGPLEQESPLDEPREGGAELGREERVLLHPEGHVERPHRLGDDVGQRLTEPAAKQYYSAVRMYICRVNTLVFTNGFLSKIIEYLTHI